jgi:hypothetical protein
MFLEMLLLHVPERREGFISAEGSLSQHGPGEAAAMDALHLR